MDRLSKSARQKAEKHSERKAFGPAVNAMSAALIKAIEQRHEAHHQHRQANTSTTTNEAHHGPHTTAQTPKGTVTTLRGGKTLESHHARPCWKSFIRTVT